MEGSMPGRTHGQPQTGSDVAGLTMGRGQRGAADLVDGLLGEVVGDDALPHEGAEGAGLEVAHLVLAVEVRVVGRVDGVAADLVALLAVGFGGQLDGRLVGTDAGDGLGGAEVVERDLVDGERESALVELEFGVGVLLGDVVARGAGVPEGDGVGTHLAGLGGLAVRAGDVGVRLAVVGQDELVDVQATETQGQEAQHSDEQIAPGVRGLTFHDVPLTGVCTGLSGAM